MVPADIWGATLRACPGVEEAGQGTAEPAPPLSAPPGALGFALLLPGGEHLVAAPTAWQRLDVEVSGGPHPRDVRVSAELATPSGPSEALISRAQDRPLYSFGEAGEQPTGLADIVATIPHVYPSMGTATDPHRYTLLVIPSCRSWRCSGVCTATRVCR